MITQTPSQTVGPFFHPTLIKSGENILADDQTNGQHILIIGKVFDGGGKPMTDALLEIWQADAQGFFNHPADPNCTWADPHFHGFGRSSTVDDGRFEFKTVKPGPVAGHGGQPQAPYINIRIFSRGLLIQVYTRLYFSDESANQSDPTLNSIEPGRRSTLIAVRQESSDLPIYRFDIHMQGEHETVFFEP